VNVDNIQCPILVIGGTADRITPISIQRKIVQRFGNMAQLKEIENCCHWTIGGQYFPKIRSTLFKWLAQ